MNINCCNACQLRANLNKHNYRLQRYKVKKKDDHYVYKISGNKFFRKVTTKTALPKINTIVNCHVFLPC